MPFEITRLLLGNQNTLSIPEDRYNEIATARRCLLEALTIEEKIDLLRENYRDLEQNFLDLSLNTELFSGGDWSAAVAEVKTVNRHLVNLLSTCRMYVDHLPQHLNVIFGDNSTQADAFQTATSEEFDQHLGYRVLYALRNYVQHSGWPIQSISHNRKRIDGDDGRQRRLITTAFIHTDYLVGSEFRKKTLEELQKLGQKIDIKPLVRENMASFGRLHTKVREMLQPQMPAWENALSSATDDYTTQFGGDTVGLAAVATSADGSVAESHSIFSEFVERRKYLERRNQRLEVHLNSYISSEAIDA